MKLLPIILFNVVTVTVALVAYDTLRSEPQPEPAEVDTSALEERIAAVENARPRNRRTTSTDPVVLERLAALEQAVAAPMAALEGEATNDATDEVSPRRFDGPELSAPIGVLSAAEIQRFRRLHEAVRREDAAIKNKARIDAALDNLPFRLTDGQRNEIHTAYAVFEPRVREIWTEAKLEAQQTIADGGAVDRGEIVANTTAVIEGEFAATLSDVVPVGDAHTVAAAVLSSGK